VSAERSSLPCSSVGDKLTIIGKVSRGKTGQGPVDERRYIELELCAAAAAPPPPRRRRAGAVFVTCSRQVVHQLYVAIFL